MIFVTKPCQCCDSIKMLVDCAIENGDFVVINADW